MPITPQNLVRHELIGLKVEVKKSTCSDIANLKGTVIDETYNILKIETKKGEKSIPKSICTFIFYLPNKKRVEVDGKLLIGRPEDRIKKKLPRW